MKWIFLCALIAGGMGLLSPDVFAQTSQATPPILKAQPVKPTPNMEATPPIQRVPPSPPARPSPSATPIRTGKLLHGFMARNTQGDQATKFLEGAAKIYAFWKGDGLKAGDRIHVVWVAEDIGFTNKSDRKITEGFSTAYKTDDDGAFSLARPSGGWPVGKYRVELYVGKALEETLKFTVEPDVTVQVQ